MTYFVLISLSINKPNILFFHALLNLNQQEIYKNIVLSLFRDGLKVLEKNDCYSELISKGAEEGVHGSKNLSLRNQFRVREAEIQVLSLSLSLSLIR